MNQPRNIMIGDRKDAITPPAILPAEYDKFHSGAFMLRQSSPSRTVVFWTAGARYFGGAPAGTHDGIRDGEQRQFADFSGLRRCYCTAEDWTEAGNDLPTD